MKLLSVLCLILCICLSGSFGKENPENLQIEPPRPPNHAPIPRSSVNYWYSPLTAISSGPAGPPSKVIVAPYCCPSTALKIWANQTVREDDSQWVVIGLSVPNTNIKGVTIYYQAKTSSRGSTYISQVRLTQMTTPDKALVIHDDANNLASLLPTSYFSPLNIKVEGIISLSLRIVIGNPGDSIILGGIMLELE